MPEITETFHAKNSKEWRQWLSKYHSKKKEIWLIAYKKHTGEENVSYDEAVCEALCFGWIDSIVKRLDDDRTAQRFSPRRKDSVWSESNVIRIKKMIKENKMMPAGLEIYKHARKPLPQNPKMPSDLIKSLKANKKALTNFMNFAPSYKRHYIWRILSAKQEETRKRRIAKLVNLSKMNVKPGDN